ncbi:MAG: NAD(P)H-quinone oxidoreductase [Saprospiraceae bacterium]|nr:NAD(P)H-quinone oxidoreductase [Pyrinomonadaceae bacterium]
MKAVYISQFGGPENLEIREVPDPPKPSGDKVLIRVKAAALNRADLLQRRGVYPAPKGFSQNIPGLEFVGEVVETGEYVPNFKPGDRVFGITAGEAQAELISINQSLLALVPGNLSFAEAAAVPEAFITAHDAIFTLGDLRESETLLIHAVGSGVGLAALQLAKAKSVTVIGTSRTADKLDRCKDFRLDHAILAGENVDFAGVIKEKNSGKGVDVILDLVGASYFKANLESLAIKGRLILVGLTGGAAADFDLGIALQKRLKIIGTVLRGRSIEEKAEAVRKFSENVLPLLESGKVKPNIDKVFKFEEVADAHGYLESNESFGKVILEF